MTRARVEWQVTDHAIHSAATFGEARSAGASHKAAQGPVRVDQSAASGLRRCAPPGDRETSGNGIAQH